MMNRIRKTIRNKPAYAKWFRMLDNPFKDREFQVIHCCHHRVGTVWFLRIMNSVALHFFLPFDKRDRVDQDPEISHTPCVFVDTHSLLEVSRLSGFRGTHIIRDPRDLVISGYHYHLWTDEEWANMKMGDLLTAYPMLKERLSLLPIESMMTISYREYLNGLSKEDGLIAEIKRASRGPIQVMGNWNYDHPDFLEIKYEDLLLDEEAIFRSIFAHYGFKPSAIEKATQIALSYSFKKMAGRNIGDVAQKSHLRSGKSKQWQDEFGQAHKDLFKKLHGQDLIKMGYETDLNW